MNLENFIKEENGSNEWGSIIEKEIKLRIELSVAAYAYEMQNESIMTDHEFDAKCKLVDPSINTGNEKLDHFFRTEFHPDTGQWIHKHPDIEGIYSIFRKHYSHRCNWR